MGQQRGRDPVRHSSAWNGVAGAVISTAVIAGLADCGNSAGPASGDSAPAASASPAPAGTGATPSGTAAATARASAAAAAFTPIVEPFDPGHPARTKPAPASCAGQPSTLAIEQCYEARTEDADTSIDAVQLAHYQSGPTAQRAAINAGDSAWLAARRPVCAKAFHSGGTVDGINAAGCLLAESTARLDALKRITPAEAVLKSTDNTDPCALSWYTTPEGSRIAMIDTQGDATGGVIISWVVIGGANGSWSTRPSFPMWTARSPTPGKSSRPTRPGTGSHRAPSTSSASTTAACPPIPSPVRAQEAGFTRRAPRWRSGASGRRASWPVRPGSTFAGVIP
jgi:uncharacterized protein YecT (DUF1311 family)